MGRTLSTLSVADTEIIVGELEHVLDLHRTWFQDFHATLVCRAIPAPGNGDEESGIKGEFGRWYKDEANPYLRRHPDFSAVGRYHREMQSVAQELSCAIDRDAAITPEQYQKFRQSADRFNKVLRKLHGEARERLHLTDPLTGVATRIAMVPRLEQERERIKRSGKPCSVGMVDLDHFKRVNDTYGHQAGDKVLQGTAKLMIENLRLYDVVYRYGGEEFVVLLPNTEPDKAKPVLDRLRRGIKRHAVALGDGTELRVSASFGVAALATEAPVATSIDRADQALYAAKEAGRNRVLIWSGDSVETSRAAGA